MGQVKNYDIFNLMASDIKKYSIKHKKQCHPAATALGHVPFYLNLYGHCKFIMKDITQISRIPYFLKLK